MFTQADALLATVTAAIVCPRNLCLKSSNTVQLVHFTYNRLEPRKLNAHFLLLFVVPSLLSAALHRSFSTIPVAILQIFGIFTLSLLTSITLYRLSPIHPLAKFPGPLIGRVTSLWLSYKALGGKRYLYFKYLHDHYGPYVRVGMTFAIVLMTESDKYQVRTLCLLRMQIPFFQFWVQRVGHEVQVRLISWP